MPLQISGDVAMVRRFRDQLAKCAGGKLKLDPKTGFTVWDNAGNSPPTPASPFSEALDGAIQSRKVTLIKLAAKPPADAKDVRWVDLYCERTVYLDHVDALPEDPPADAPQATTRCEALIHILAEYTSAVENGDTSCTNGFEGNHREGLKAQERFRKHRKQNKPKPQHLRKDGSIIFEHEDGSTTVIKRGESGTIIVEHGAAPRKNEEKKEEKKPVEKKPVPEKDAKSLRSSLFEAHPYAFVGTVVSLGEPGPAWSSFGLAFQLVTYRVDENLGAPLPGSFVDVEHVLVPFSASAEPPRGARRGRRTDLGRPGLSRRLFAPGRRLMIFADLAERTPPEYGLVLQSTVAEPVIAIIDRPSPPTPRGRARG
jgi:hypothetical protein